jgi:Uncharacterized protein conserved in bacteria (DUF2200)
MALVLACVDEDIAGQSGQVLMKTDAATLKRVYAMSLAGVYPHYVVKAEKKGRTKAEVDEIIRWLSTS